MTGDATPALTVRGLAKSFDAPVLRGLDLDVPAGAFVALLGPSGCGKTTLLRIVAGHERADAGTVTVAGREVSAGTTTVAPEKRGVGLVPQEGALFPHLSVRGNVAFGLPRRDRSGTRVDELLALVGLPGLGDRMPHELSGGQQQRVAVARALAPEPALVLLDEPFSALDADLRGQVRAEVREALRTAGAAGVLVTHDQQEALSVADVVAVIRDGVVVQAGAPWEVYGSPVDLGVARSLGETVVMPGEGHGATVLTALGTLPLAVPAHGSLEVALRPEQLRVATGPAGAAGVADGVAATVVRRTFYGHDAVLGLQLAGGLEVDARVATHELRELGSAAQVVVRGPVVAFPAT